jgi:nicotinamide mononucleotide transporter
VNSLQHLTPALVAQMKATPWLEWIAIVAAVVEVLLAKANKVWLYPAGIVSTGIYTYLFLRPETKLYADALLNCYYFAMSIYGWMLWGQRVRGRELAISTIGFREWLFVVMLIALASLGLAFLLVKVFPLLFVGYIPSDVAAWDAFVSGAAWVGMWLLARRKVENWLVLNVSNAAAVPLLLYKGMPFTAALTLFLFVVAIFGYREWRGIYKKGLGVA